MAITLLVNPAAGKGSAQRHLADISGLLRDELADVSIVLSRDFDDAAKLAAAAVTDSDGLIVMGGDGMMHLGVNACAQTSVPLGLIPAGTGNDLCRGLGIGVDGPLAAARHIIARRMKAVDLIQVQSYATESGPFVGTIVASGFDAMVNRRANALSWPHGSMRYPLATLAELRVFTPLRYQLTVDGEQRNLDAMLVAVGNTNCYGGGMQICAGADATDGLLDITIIHPVSRTKLLRLLPQMYSGRFVADPAVEQSRARQVIVDADGLRPMGDGEPLGAAPLSLTAAPGALTIFAPPT